MRIKGLPKKQKPRGNQERMSGSDGKLKSRKMGGIRAGLTGGGPGAASSGGAGGGIGKN